MIRLYADSKEFPMHNYERVKSTGDYGYVIKGYDGGDEMEADLTELEKHFNFIVQDYVLSLNTVNYDIVQYGRVNGLKLELTMLLSMQEIIEFQIKTAALKGKEDITLVHTLLEGFKMQKSSTLLGQMEIVQRKIDKLQNDIAETLKKIEKNNPVEIEETDVNEMVVNVEGVIGRSLDLRILTLYRFGLIQNQALKIQEQQIKNANRR